MEDRWTNGPLSIKTVARLDLPEAINWLHLVGGRWLLVASSDNRISRLSCFDASLAFSGSPKPVAESWFEAPIHKAGVEVQGNRIVIAAGVGHPYVSLHFPAQL